MKISFDVDCSPEEARRFLGLPDMSPVNEVFVDSVSKKIGEAANSLDPQTLMATLFPTGIKGFEDMQRVFWEQFSSAARKDTD